MLLGCLALPGLGLLGHAATTWPTEGVTSFLFFFFFEGVTSFLVEVLGVFPAASRWA